MPRRSASRTNWVQTMNVKPNNSSGSSRCSAKKLVDAVPVGRQIARGGSIQGKDGFRGEIAHAANGRAPGGQAVALADRVGRVEHQKRPPLVADVLLEDRHQRSRLAERRRLVDHDPAWLLAGGRRRVQLADDLLRRNGAEREVFEHRHRQRRHVGRRSPGVDVAAELVQESAIAGAAVGHVAAERASSGVNAASFSACAVAYCGPRIRASTRSLLRQCRRK